MYIYSSGKESFGGFPEQTLTHSHHTQPLHGVQLTTLLYHMIDGITGVPGARGRVCGKPASSLSAWEFPRATPRREDTYVCLRVWLRFLEALSSRRVAVPWVLLGLILVLVVSLIGWQIEGTDMSQDESDRTLSFH